MIIFDVDRDIKKSLFAARSFARLDTRLHPVIETTMEWMRDNGTVMTVTSVYRANSKDHRDRRAFDIRVWSLAGHQRLDLVDHINAHHPAEDGERPTAVYYHQGRPHPRYTEATFDYAPHIHIRVPSVFEYPISETMDEAFTDKAGGIA